MVRCDWRKLPYMSCWPLDRWKSWQSTSCLPGLWSTWTCLPASATVTPYWWQGISVPNIWTGILGRPQGAASYVITPVKIPVWFTGQIPQPLLCRTLSPPNVLDIVVTKDLVTPVCRTTFLHWVPITYQYWLTHAADHPFSTYRFLSISKRPTGPNSRLAWRPQHEVEIDTV
jgi:hypothetical protein